MNTRQLALAVATVVVWALVCAVGQSAHGQDAPDARPNILLVMTDDQTFESIAHMPNVQALAARGTEYTDYQANFPLCCPSRATTLTGQYVHNHGVWGNGGRHGGGYQALKPSIGNTLPVWLHDAGYKTMMVGKFLNGYDHTDGVPPGWDRWRVREADESRGYWDVPVMHEDGLVYPTKGYSTYQYRNIARDLIHESASTGRPWFMWLSFNAPHSAPSDVDPDDLPRHASASPALRDRDTFEGATAPSYGTALFNEHRVADKPRFVGDLPKMAAAMIAALNEAYSQQLEAMQSVDRSIAVLEDELAATGQLESTVIAFTTDNGLFFGEHRIAAGKYAPYPAASHLPLVVAGPGFGSDVTDERPRLNTDLAPTLIDLAGAAARRDMDGVSLRQSVAADRPLLLEGRMPFSSGGVAYRVSQFSAVRSPGWFYARYRYTDGTVDVELYDLAHDPGMLFNRHGEPGYRVREVALRSAMEGLAGYVVVRR